MCRDHRSFPAYFSGEHFMRNLKSFIAGSGIGTLGGLIGLGGAEFRLPVLVAGFRFNTLQAIILNLVISLVTVFFSFIFRSGATAVETILNNGFLILNLLSGTLIGSYCGALFASRIKMAALNKAVMVLLVGLSAIMMFQHFFPFSANPLFSNTYLMFSAGMAAGLVIGSISSLLGVAGGELLIPTFMLLYGVDIKLAGSLSLAVSFPTLIVGIAKYASSDSFKIVGAQKVFLSYMALGSIAGAYAGSLLLGIVSSSILSLALGVILLVSAVKIFHGK